jgi:hypothetical protein
VQTQLEGTVSVVVYGSISDENRAIMPQVWYTMQLEKAIKYSGIVEYLQSIPYRFPVLQR